MQLAAEVNWLVDHVRWDVEDDLARVIGDVPAHTIANGARRVVDGAAAVRRRARRQGRRVRRRRMRRFYRGIFIVWVALRYGLDELVLTSFQKPWLRVVARIVSVGRNLDAPRGQRLRVALERLGPIFVKFGQVLSTRRDLLPPDIADELARLQDRVPPFRFEDRDRDHRARLPPAGRRDLRAVRRDAGRQRLDRAGALRDHARRPTARARGRGQGAAARHARRDREGPGADAHDGRLGRAALGRRQAPEAARGGGRVRQVPARRARPGARGGQRRAAAAQHGRARTWC